MKILHDILSQLKMDFALTIPTLNNWKIEIIQWDNS